MTVVVQQTGEDWGPSEDFMELVGKVMEKLRSLKVGCTCEKPTYGFLYIGDVQPPPKPVGWAKAVEKAKEKGADIPEEPKPPNRQMHVVYCTACDGLTHAYVSDEMWEQVPELNGILPPRDKGQFYLAPPPVKNLLPDTWGGWPLGNPEESKDG